MLYPDIFQFRFRNVLIAAFIYLVHTNAFADITRVYHPYVDPLEREIEFRLTQSHDDIDKHTNLYSLGYGQAVSEKLFLEAYIIGSESDDSGADVEAFEAEALYQLTDKGSRAVDYGILIELERENENNITEAGATLLMEKEFDATSLTTNLGVIYEFGSGIDNEIDTLLRLQWRYRYQPSLEPALELYLDEYDKAAGPALIGLWRLSPGQKLRWETGLLFAIDDETPDTILRFSFEYEF